MSNSRAHRNHNQSARHRIASTRAGLLTGRFEPLESRQLLSAVTMGSGLSATIDAAAGDTLTFHYDLISSAKAVPTGVQDFAYYTLNGKAYLVASQGQAVNPSVDIYANGFQTGSAATAAGYTGSDPYLLTTTVPITSAGSNTFGIGVVNAGGGGSSVLVLDDIELIHNGVSTVITTQGLQTGDFEPVAGPDFAGFGVAGAASLQFLNTLGNLPAYKNFQFATLSSSSGVTINSASNATPDIYSLSATTGTAVSSLQALADQVNPVPSGPLNLAASVASSSEIDLNWLDTASNEAGYAVERELTTAGPWTVIATLPANSTSYADTGLAASTQYIYRVRAFNAAGDSAFAGPQAATTRPILSTPVVTVTDAGGVYNGQGFAAVATVKGNTGIPGSSLEGVKPVLTYYVGTTATGTPSSTAPKNAGTYTVNANFPGSANYAAASASATFTITKAKLLVTAKNALKVYGATLPALTASITGFVPGDSSAAVTGSPTLSTLVTATSNVGTYPITATIGSLAAANYTFQFANGALVVSAANTAVALSSSVSGTAAPGQAITFTATVSAVAPGSGTPSGKVQFYVDGNAFGSAVTLSSTGVALSNSSALPPGSHTITAAYISSTTNFNNSNAAAIKQSVGKYTATLSNLSAPTIDRFTPFVTLGGTVTGSNGSVKPTGTVTISAYFNGQLEASHTAAIKSDGSFAAQFLTLLARSGQHTLVYSYSGDANYVATSSTVIATVKTKVDLGDPDKWAGIEQRLNDLLD